MSEKRTAEADWPEIKEVIDDFVEHMMARGFTRDRALRLLCEAVVNERARQRRSEFKVVVGSSRSG